MHKGKVYRRYIDPNLGIWWDFPVLLPDRVYCTSGYVWGLCEVFAGFLTLYSSSPVYIDHDNSLAIYYTPIDFGSDGFFYHVLSINLGPDNSKMQYDQFWFADWIPGSVHNRFEGSIPAIPEFPWILRPSLTNVQLVERTADGDWSESGSSDNQFAATTYDDTDLIMPAAAATSATLEAFAQRIGSRRLF